MENEPKITEEVETRQAKSASSRNFVYIALVVLLLGAGAYIYLKNKPTTEVKTGNQGQTQVFREEKPKISDERKKILQAEMEGIETQIKNLDGDGLSGERDKLYTRLAGVKNQLGDFDGAVKELNKVSGEYKDKTARVWAYYIMAYRGMGEKAKGLEAANKALSLDAENPEYFLSQIEFTEGKSNDELKSMYEQALKKTDESIEVVVSYARFLESIGDKPGAILYWTKAGEVNNSNKAKYDAEITRLNQQ